MLFLDYKHRINIKIYVIKHSFVTHILTHYYGLETFLEYLKIITFYENYSTLLNYAIKVMQLNLLDLDILYVRQHPLCL